MFRLDRSARSLLLAACLVYLLVLLLDDRKVEAKLKRECTDHTTKYPHQKDSCTCPSVTFEVCGELFQEARIAIPSRIDKERLLKGSTNISDNECWCIARPICDKWSVLRRRCDPQPEEAKERFPHPRPLKQGTYTGDDYSNDLMELREVYFSYGLEALSNFVGVVGPMDPTPGQDFYELLMKWFMLNVSNEVTDTVPAWSLIQKTSDDVIKAIKDVQQDTSLKTFAGVIEGLVKSIKDVDAISVESFAERVSLFRKYIGGLEKHEKDEELKKHRKELTDIGHQMGKWGGLLERELLYQYLKQKGARLQISLKQRALHGFPYAVLRGWRVQLNNRSTSYIGERLNDVHNGCIAVKDIPIRKVLSVAATNYIFDDMTATLIGCEERWPYHFIDEQGTNQPQRTSLNGEGYNNNHVERRMEAEIHQDSVNGLGGKRIPCPDEESNVWCVNSFLIGMPDFALLQKDTAF